MNIYDAFPSKWVKAVDLKDREVNVCIREVKLEKIGPVLKPVLYFHGASKGLVLNKTNATAIAILYSEETDRWVGKEIVLYPTKVNFQDKLVPSIRVKGPKLREVKSA